MYNPEIFEYFLRRKGVSTGNKNDPRYFTEAINAAIENYGITPGEIAGKLTIPIPAVHRWTRMNNLPQPMIRKIALEGIASLIDELPPWKEPNSDKIRDAA